jgi:pimeloyl-ACP methyl ester carboxylesterase
MRNRRPGHLRLHPSARHVRVSPLPASSTEAKPPMSKLTMGRQPVVRTVVLSGGRRLRVRTWAGKGAPLVLLHGLLDDSEGWAELAARTQRPCLAVDLPGFGGSDCPTRPRISAYAEAVAEGLEHIGIDSCTLVGHSLGGAVATAVAERTRVVDALALIAPAGFGSIRLAEAMALPGVVDLAERTLPLALINPLTATAGYTTFVAHRTLPSRDLLNRLRRRAFQSGPGVRAATIALAASGRSERAFFKRPVAFDGPVAALWGSKDALVPVGHTEGLRRALPQAHIEVWRGMGHHPQRERPDDLCAFVERHAAARRRSVRVVTPLRRAA